MCVCVCVCVGGGGTNWVGSHDNGIGSQVPIELLRRKINTKKKFRLVRGVRGGGGFLFRNNESEIISGVRIWEYSPGQ